MAFDLDAAGGLGNGTTDVIADSNTVVNHYAAVSALTATTITLDDASDFNVGDEIFYHVSTTYDDNRLGRWAFANIAAKNGNVLTVDKDLTALAKLNNSACQVISVPHYKNFTIPSGVTLSPPAFANGKGGIFVCKCSQTFTLAGDLSLVDKGLPADSNRPYLEQEQQGKGKLDTDPYAGWENAATKYQLALNVGDGAAFILADEIHGGNSARIGNPNATGVKYCRGADDSPNKPEGMTNIGGSTIMLVANRLTSETNFHRHIAKYRSGTAGRGLARCYLATGTLLSNDEGLYSYDVISDGSRLKKYCNVKDFGAGTGNLTNQANVNSVFNTYARVTEINGKVITYVDKSKAGAFKQGDLVMIHYCQKSNEDTTYAGRFWLSYVDGDDGIDKLTLRDKPPIGNAYLDKYSAQIVLVPQYNNFTLSTTNNKTPKFADGKGGIFAIAVKGTCDLRGGIIDVEGKGGAPAYGKINMVIGNTHNSTRLPIGEGHGSVFILAKYLRMNSATRIGATYSGSPASGYRGKDGKDLPSPISDRHVSPDQSGTGGSPSGAGINADNKAGGYGSNAETVAGRKGLQGAHIFIIADTTEELCVDSISTGGQAYQTTHMGNNGGAGYGGGGVTDTAITQVTSTGLWGTYVAVGGQGGYIAGGGGGSDETGGGGAGTAFIYCNQAVNQGLVSDFPY